MERVRDRCPCCGAALYCAVVFTGGDAFCMECGEVFSINKPNKRKEKIMKKLIETVEKDYLKEDFSVSECVVFGIVVPVVLIAIMGVAGWMDSMGGL